MTEIWETYKSGSWVVPFLTFTIYFFVAASFILYLYVVASRNRNIKRTRLGIEYNAEIEKMMASVIFEDLSFDAVKQDKNFLVRFDTYFFRAVLIESIINLHKNYEGIYAQKIELFYKESGLIKDSFKKLKSIKWEIKCKGITELAEFNVTDAFDTIINYSKARNKTLKITAINACIKLAGTQSIVYLVEHPDPIDEWTQVNIISAFKKHDVGDTEGIELLLESQNSTVVTLGLKLIKELKLTQKIPFVAQLAAKSSNTLIQYEAQSILQTLTV
nr:hypothetical protein [uncultured Flavobacterium sp.]